MSHYFSYTQFEEYEFQTLRHWDNEAEEENLHNDGFVMQDEDEDALRDESLWRALDV